MKRSRGMQTTVVINFIPHCGDRANLFSLRPVLSIKIQHHTYLRLTQIAREQPIAWASLHPLKELSPHKSRGG